MIIDFEQITELLQNENLSDIAQKTGISYETLQEWKTGKNNWLEQAEERLTKIQNYINVEEKKIEQERIEEQEEKGLNIGNLG